MMGGRKCRHVAVLLFLSIQCLLPACVLVCKFLVYFSFTVKATAPKLLQVWCASVHSSACSASFRSLVNIACSLIVVAHLYIEHCAKQEKKKELCEGTTMRDK